MRGFAFLQCRQLLMCKVTGPHPKQTVALYPNKIQLAVMEEESVV